VASWRDIGLTKEKMSSGHWWWRMDVAAWEVVVKSSIKMTVLLQARPEEPIRFTNCFTAALV